MLFLGSGSVIHGMEPSLVTIHHSLKICGMMGGLRKYMPITAITFLIGCLAISGIPPFAGFWSKDEILANAFAANPVFWAVGYLTAGITAFYMFRMYFSTFEGNFAAMNPKSAIKLKSADGVAVAAGFKEPVPAFGPGAMDTRELGC
jgi:NAD(P)H-quinone oxidoreductase subunit 5